MRSLAVVLFLVFAQAAYAQRETLVAGHSGICSGITTPTISPTSEWVGAGPYSDPGPFELVAPAADGRFYGIASSNTAFEVWAIDAGGETRLRGPIPGLVFGLVSDVAGNLNVLYGAAGSHRRLLRLSPQGSQLADHDLGVGTIIGVGTVVGLGDTCTLFFVTWSGTIRRVNACTGELLRDFATVQSPPARAIRILPDGGVIVSTGNGPSFQLERYTAAGVLTGSLPIESDTAALMLRADGDLMYGLLHCSGRLITRDLTTGAIESVTSLQSVEIPLAIASRSGWTAAIGATSAPAIPTAGPAALFLMAIALAALAASRLMG